MVLVENMLIAHVTFRGERHFLAILPSPVGERRPIVRRVVDHGGGNLLGDDPLHHLVDHLLFLACIRHVGIIRLEFVAQVPV